MMKKTVNLASTLNDIEQRPFGLRDKIGYMFGDLGNCFILGLLNAFLTIYYTNVLGISGAMIGILFLTARFIDAFADVTVGRMADMTKLTKEGRFRPWIRWAKWPFCLIIIIIFLPVVKGFPEMIKIGYIFVTYLLYGIFLSCFNIPYGSLASAMSSNPDHRASLSIYRSVGSAIGAGGVGFILPLIVYTTSETGKKLLSGTRLFYCAIGCVILSFICYLLLYKMTTERVRVEKKENVKLSVLLKGMVTDRALMALVIVDLVVVVTTSLLGVTTTYMFTDYFQSNQALSIALLFTYGTTVILAPIAKWLNTKFGKKEASTVALFFAAGMYLLMYLLHLHNAWLYLTLLLFATFGTAMFNLMIWAFITDVIDNHQYVTGMREDGTVYGVNSFARKVGQAIAGGAGGFLLSIIGYKSSTSGGTAQSEVVLNRIYAAANLIPFALLLIAGVVLFFWYPLNKKKINEVDAELVRINEKQQ
ncbi:MFS transporter [Latilactobacillus sakei]|uniref:MFS transporter n=1 Tax=Latilactobacillus sakei TaxID=1599 RepID=UPI003F52A0A0